MPDKIFTLRHISQEFHQEWKSFAAMHSTTMERVAITAIKQYMKKVTEEEEVRKDGK